MKETNKQLEEKLKSIYKLLIMLMMIEKCRNEKTTLYSALVTIDLYQFKLDYLLLLLLKYK